MRVDLASPDSFIEQYGINDEKKKMKSMKAGNL
jgi:hypothetical protein